MNRRTVLGALGISLTAGCTDVQGSSQSSLTIENKTVIPTEEFPTYTEPNNSSEKLGTLISENPETNEIYITHTVRLPTPAHQVEYTITEMDNGRGVTINYSASYQAESDIQTRSVIQPTPHTLRLKLSEINKNNTIAIESINDNRLSYTTKNKKQTNLFKE